MKILLYVCFILFVTNKAVGQTTDSVCWNAVDFDACLNSWNCDETISRCYCYDEQPYCQCHSRKGEFYTDESCSQRWTVVTFALVASLPGLTLAVLVGVIVYVLMLSSMKSHTGAEIKTPKITPKEEDLFPGITFASDVNGRHPSERPVQQDLSMAAMTNHPYSRSSGMRDTPVGVPAQPYSPSSSVHPSVDRMNDRRPHETNSMYNGMRDPRMGGSARPYSNGTGLEQIVSNPYARDSPTKNPYEDQRPSADIHDYRVRDPSDSYDNLKRPYVPPPLHTTSEHGNLRSGFPRPQVNLQY